MQSTCQIYVKGSVEATAFYQQAFNLTFGMTALNEDGTYEHVSLMYGDKEFLAIAEDVNDMHGYAAESKWPIMAFNVYPLESREAVDRVYKILSEGALLNENPDGPAVPWWDDSAEFYGFSLVDKFGVNWGVMA